MVQHEYEILVTGMKPEPPDVRDKYTNLKIEVKRVDTGKDHPLPAEGLLLARVDPDETYQYGDIIRLRGKIKTPPENEEFSHRDYLERFGIHSYMSIAEVTRLPLPRGVISSWQGFICTQENIYQLFPDPEASLIAGTLLGVDTGTAHVIAISGFNIAIIAGPFATFLAVFSPFNRKPDWLIIASIEENQLAALPRVLDRFPPETCSGLGTIRLPTHPVRWTHG